MLIQQLALDAAFATVRSVPTGLSESDAAARRLALVPRTDAIDEPVAPGRRRHLASTEMPRRAARTRVITGSTAWSRPRTT